MNTQSLGRLKRVELREIWNSESADFTPWLARPENLAVLEEALGMQLEVEAEEKEVGPFRADILCKDLGTNTWVLIENQLERTDHLHLGQLLTYAAGLQAVTVIWVAARFADEHRAALDWLNEITDGRFRFFGLEVEVCRIGDSLPAARLHVVSKPNEWSRAIKRRSENLSDRKVTQVRYWTEFHEVLNAAGGPVSGNRKPQPESWMSYSVGRSGFTLDTATTFQKRRIQVSLYLSGDKAKLFLGLLKQQRDAIEEGVGCPFEWREMGKQCRITAYLENVDPEDESDWPRQHEWLATKINAMHAIFSPRIRNLNADDLEEGEH